MNQTQPCSFGWWNLVHTMVQLVLCHYLLVLQSQPIDPLLSLMSLDEYVGYESFLPQWYSCISPSFNSTVVTPPGNIASSPENKSLNGSSTFWNSNCWYNIVMLLFPCNLKKFDLHNLNLIFVVWITPMKICFTIVVLVIRTIIEIM